MEAVKLLRRCFRRWFPPPSLLSGASVRFHLPRLLLGSLFLLRTRHLLELRLLSLLLNLLRLLLGSLFHLLRLRLGSLFLLSTRHPLQLRLVLFRFSSSLSTSTSSSFFSFEPATFSYSTS